MKLYSMPLSGHSHRAHLFLSLIGVANDIAPVDLGKCAHKTPFA
jgi:glutathione S-transferase